MSKSKDSHTFSLSHHKKFYAAPTLSRFGNLTELTRGGGGPGTDSLGRGRRRSINNVSSPNNFS